MPVFGGEDDAEVRYGDVVTVYGVVMGLLIRGLRFVVRDDLVAEEVEVDPGIGAAAFSAAENRAVKVTGSGQVVYGEGDVEGAQAHLVMILGFEPTADPCGDDRRKSKGHATADFWKRESAC